MPDHNEHTLDATIVQAFEQHAFARRAGRAEDDTFIDGVRALP